MVLPKIIKEGHDLAYAETNFNFVLQRLLFELKSKQIEWATNEGNTMRAAFMKTFSNP